jgi:hypothetical protein
MRSPYLYNLRTWNMIPLAKFNARCSKESDIQSRWSCSTPRHQPETPSRRQYSRHGRVAMFPPNTLWLPPTTTESYTRGSGSRGVVGTKALTAPRGDLRTAVTMRDGRLATGSRHPPARGQGVAIDIEGCDGTKANAHEGAIRRR